MDQGRQNHKRKAGKKQWNGVVSKHGRCLNRAIWSNTPHDVQLRILKFLPISSLCRFRCVSRPWNSAITGTIPSSRSGCSFISLRDDMDVTIGFPWKTFPLALTKQGFVSFVTTSRGLVLATHALYAAPWLSIHNPFVPGSARVVGPLTEIRGFQGRRTEMLLFSGIQALPGSDGKKIGFAAVCVSLTSERLVRVHVFDSRRWSWVVECARVPGVGYGHQETVYVGYENRYTFLLKDHILYFLTVCENGTRCLRSLNIWDPEHTCKTLATWTDLPFNLHQNLFHTRWEINHPSLISCQGKLMLVNVIPGGGIGFVYLDEESGSWVGVTCFSMGILPRKVKKKNLEKSNTGCVWAAGTPESSTVALHFVHCHWGCIFDLADSTWRSASHEEMFQPFHPSLLTF